MTSWRDLVAIVRRKNDQTGFTLGEAVVAPAIVVLIIVIAATLFTQIRGIQKRSGLADTLETLRFNIAMNLQNDRSLRATAADPFNSTLACINNGTDCSAAGGPFRLLDAGGNVIVDTLAATSSTARGFTEVGTTCNTFSTATPDPNCPIQVAMNWAPICPTAPCYAPHMQLNATFTYNGTKQVPNLTLYNVTISLRPGFFQIVINSTQANFNVQQYVSTVLAATPDVAFKYIIILNAGFALYSTDSTIPAFSSGNLPPGSSIELTNKGGIYGAGGFGGVGGYPNAPNAGRGGKGGAAIATIVPLTIDNTTGTIYGGGGGGGGGSGGANPITDGGGGGGGGAGNNGGPGGWGAANGLQGTLGGATGGAGGAGGGAGGTGGTGGGYGQAGSAGAGGGTPAGAPGGLGGEAVLSNGAALVWNPPSANNASQVKGAVK